MEKVLPLREAVQLLLNKSGDTKYQMAKRMGLNPQGFDSSLKRDVRLTTFFKMAEALGITPAQLAEEVEKQRV